MTPVTIAVVSAGMSEPSSTRLLADQLGDAVRDRLVGDDLRIEVRTIELRELAHDITNNVLTGFPLPALRQAIDAVTQADALIAVTPIFNASYSGLFKSFFDVFEHKALAGKPVLIAATGGTARHSLALEHALRPLFAYLQSFVVPTAVFAASEDWGRAGSNDSGLAARIERAADELSGLLTGRARPAAVDPYEDPTPFDQLLSGS